jgi:hypothetical protein
VVRGVQCCCVSWMYGPSCCHSSAFSLK